LVDTLGTAVDSLFFQDKAKPQQLAPIIVVAVVEENRIVAKHVEAARYASVYLDLHAVRCKRENSLKGGLTEAGLEFFYFADGRYADSKPSPHYKRQFQAEPGSRYLFFLSRDRDVLRSIGDVGEYSVLVATGAHPDLSTTNGDTGSMIPEILLTPGNGADFALMASGSQMERSSSIADAWGSRLLTVQLLRRLTLLPEPVRSSACGWLVTSYDGQGDCLQAIAGDANESPENRQEALRELKEQNDFRPRLLEHLKDPARLMDGYLVDDSRRRVREELQTMLFGTDKVLHERVCTALKRYYPYEVDPRCSEKKENSPQR
jgi:hypothetical protein